MSILPLLSNCRYSPSRQFCVQKRSPRRWLYERLARKPDQRICDAALDDELAASPLEEMIAITDRAMNQGDMAAAAQAYGQVLEHDPSMVAQLPGLPFLPRQS